MLGIAILLIVAAVGFFLLRSHSSPNYSDSFMGSALVGMLLGYLLEEALINSEQLKQWENLNPEELQQTLAEEGILDTEKFDSLVSQITEKMDFSAAGNSFNEETFYQETTDEEWFDV